MIYSYHYIDHTIQRFHKGIMYFFEQMIALDLENYDQNQHLEPWFKPLVNASSTTLLGNMSTLVEEFHKLTDEEKENVKQVFEANQNIQELCQGGGAPKKYEDLTNEAFRTLIRTFFDGLWDRIANKDNGMNKKVIEKCGTILHHFQTFRGHDQHRTRICPFCGLNPLKPSLSPNRNAYDHYLPKAQYPFIAVNFENLVPMCHDCNSYEKTTDDTLFDGATRRVVYYPFDPLDDDHLEVQIIKETTFNEDELSTMLKHLVWHYELYSNGVEDIRLENWDAIFRLKGRYEEILHDHEQDWFDDVFAQYKKHKDNNLNFAQIQAEILKDLRKDLLKSERAIVRYSYAQFLLNEDGVEEDFELMAA